MTAARVERAASGGAMLTVGLCYLVALFEGFDLQAAGVAAPRLGPAFHMDPGQLGLFFSASTFGLMLGAAIGGRLSDHFGRKAVLIAATVAFGIMSTATAFSPDVTTLTVLRFLTGVGLGGALPNLVALAAENSEPGRKNTFVALLYSGMPSGGALASLVSLLGGAKGWQTVFEVGGLAPIIAAPLLLVFLPESRQLIAARSEGLSDRGGFVRALFQEGRAGRTLLLWTAFFLSLVTFYILLNWLPTLLVQRGLSRPNAAWVQVSFNVFAAAGSVGTGMLMDRWPTARVVTGAFVVAALGLILLAAAPVEPALSILVGGVVGATLSTTQALLYALAPTTYPTEVRGTGVGSAVAVGRLGSAVGPLLAGAYLGGGAAPQTVLSLLIPIIAIAGAAGIGLGVRIDRGLQNPSA